MKPRIPKDSGHNIHCQQIDGNKRSGRHRPRFSTTVFLSQRALISAAASAGDWRVPPHSWLAQMFGHSRGAGISQSLLRRTGLAQAVRNSVPICCGSQLGSHHLLTLMWKAAPVNLGTYCVAFPALYKVSAPSLAWSCRAEGIFFNPSSLFLIHWGFPSSQIMFQKTKALERALLQTLFYLLCVTSLCRDRIDRPAEPDLTVQPASVP